MFDNNLKYLISFGFINGGVASVTFDTDSITKMYHINMTGRTIGVANALYKILDIYDCYMDPETLLPVKAIRNVREGSYREYNEVIFDHHSWPDSAIAISQKSGLQILPNDILDILSGFYYLRKEILRFFRVASQTLLTPIITASLYLFIFAIFLSQ